MDQTEELKEALRKAGEPSFVIDDEPEEIGLGEVIETVELRYFQKILPDHAGGADYYIMEASPTRNGAIRLKLPKAMTDNLASETLDIRINKQAKIIVMLPGRKNDIPITKAYGSQVVTSGMLADIFAVNHIELPARYRVVYDDRIITDEDRIGGWVARLVKEKAGGDRPPKKRAVQTFGEMHEEREAKGIPWLNPKSREEGDFVDGYTEEGETS